MPSVLDYVPTTNQVAELAGVPAGSSSLKLVSTPEAATIMGLSEATLRNYAWLNSLSTDERTSRKLQEPPAGLPVPTRKSGRLLWPLGDVMKFVELKSKQAE